MPVLNHTVETSTEDEERVQVATTTVAIATTETTDNDPQPRQHQPTVQVQGLPLDWTRLGVNGGDNREDGTDQPPPPMVIRYPSDVVESIGME